MRRLGSVVAYTYLALVYGFIFLPVVALMLFSFHDGLVPVPPFRGPTLHWYAELLRDERMMDALRNSVWVGPTDKGVEIRSDVSGYLVSNGAFLFSNEQQKTNVPKDDQYQASWEHEPINARRVVGVDERGEIQGEDNPVPVKEGTDWDRASITRDGDDDILQVEFSKLGETVETIDLEYNGEKSVIEVIKS